MTKKRNKKCKLRLNTLLGVLLLIVSALVSSGIFRLDKVKQAEGYSPVEGRYVFDNVTGDQSTIISANRYEDALSPSRNVVALDYGALDSDNFSVLEMNSGIAYVFSTDTLVVGSMELGGGSLAIADGASIVLRKPVWFKDSDQDGIPSSLAVYVGDKPEVDINKNIRMYDGAIDTLLTDCNDADPVANITVDGYLDADNDGYGTGSLLTCGQSGVAYVANNTDCDDTNASILSVSASGGTITSSGSEYTHTFTSSGTFALTCPVNLNTSVLVVGGGGGAGYQNSDALRGGGGGGAGGLIYIPSYSLSTGSYTVTVGTGGAAGTSASDKGNNGNDSVFGTLTALGGGGGASRDNRQGEDGGSGGGAGRYDGAAGNTSTGLGLQPSQSGDSGTYGYGNRGFANSNDMGGGGGAGYMGGYVYGSKGWTESACSGGVGMDVDGVTYATGGSCNSNGAAGAANTGNGGNTKANTSSGVGGAGGSGVVVVKYLLP